MATFEYAIKEVESIDFVDDQLVVQTTEELPESEWGRLAETYAGRFESGANKPDNYICVVGNAPDWLIGKVPNVMGPLAPPYELIGPFIDEKKSRGTTGDVAHNSLWDELEFSDSYQDYLREDTEARQCIKQIADRIRSGEDITLVGVWGSNKYSPRDVIYGEVMRELSEDDSETEHSIPKKLEESNDANDAKLERFVDKRFSELLEMPIPDAGAWEYRETNLSQSTFQALYAHNWIEKVESGDPSKWKTTEKLWNEISDSQSITI